MAFIGRRALASELKLMPVERTLKVVWWAMHKLQRCTAFARGGTMVVLADEDVLGVIKLGTPHPRLAAYVIDLSMYNVTWYLGRNFF